MSWVFFSMPIVVDHLDLERKINCLLALAVDHCSSNQSLTITLKGHPLSIQQDVYVRWSLAKSSEIWTPLQCQTFIQTCLDKLKLNNEFGITLDHTQIEGNTIWVFFHLYTLQREP